MGLCGFSMPWLLQCLHNLKDVTFVVFYVLTVCCVGQTTELGIGTLLGSCSYFWVQSDVGLMCDNKTAKRNCVNSYSPFVNVWWWCFHLISGYCCDIYGKSAATRKWGIWRTTHSDLFRLDSIMTDLLNLDSIMTHWFSLCEWRSRGWLPTVRGQR